MGFGRFSTEIGSPAASGLLRKVTGGYRVAGYNIWVGLGQGLVRVWVRMREEMVLGSGWVI